MRANASRSEVTTTVWPPAARACSAQRGEHVVGLQAVGHADADAELAQDLDGEGQLLDERLELLAALRLVLRPLLAPQRAVGVVEAHHDRGRADPLDRGEQLGEQPADGPGGHAGVGLRVVAAVHEGVPVDRHQHRPAQHPSTLTCRGDNFAGFLDGVSRVGERYARIE